MCKFFTGVSHGVVILRGEVDSEEVSQNAEKCAASHPNVRGVINNIRVTGAAAQPIDNRFLQPAIGKEMYFRDGIFGIVRQVVINPDNRRVTAMIIQGHFNSLHQSLGSFDQSAASLADQLLVIPMSLMGYMTESSGSLSICSTDAGGKQIFDPDMFAAPEKTWVPPFPYCRQEVLFPLEFRQPTPSPARPMSKKEEIKVAEVLNANDSLGG